MKKTALLFVCSIAVFLTSMANNVVVSTVSLGPQVTGGPISTHYTQVNYDITWQNSWRTSTNESNYDGCWIFVKFRKQSTSVWQHATLNLTGHTIPSGSQIQAAADGKGVWMHRNADGIGTVNWTAASLRWNYGADGVLDNENVEVRVYAVEMVYIPQGAFTLGGIGIETYSFKDGSSTNPFQVTSEAAITAGTAAGNLNAAGAFLASGTIPAAFPKGFNAFWIMKYEFSNQQYLDFLNTLDQTTAITRNAIAATGSVPAMVVTFPERAANALSAIDELTWLDWAAMRPFTEMEFEKACRGSGILPSPNEYAWGNTTLTQIGTPSNTGLNNETWAVGNCNYSWGNAMRCGALATGASNRTSSGGTYYGVMEMSGNEMEVCVYAGNATGRSFTGLHGNGMIAGNGEHDVANWPNSTTNINAAGARGGYFVSGVNVYLQISDRNIVITNNATIRYNGYGGRGARTGE